MVAKRKNINIDSDISMSMDDMMEDNQISITLGSGKVLSLVVEKYDDQDILSKTNVHPKNRRIQKYLNEQSLAPLIASIRRTGQITLALGRREPDGSVTIIYGSRRRKGTFLAGKPFYVLVSDDLTDKEAAEISDAENVSEDISLIERGMAWLNLCDSDGMSSREIAEGIEEGKVSHTWVALGIEGARIPRPVTDLYPSLNTINKTRIKLLTKACEANDGESIANHINDDHSETLIGLWDAFGEGNQSVLASSISSLDDAITQFTTKKKVKPAAPFWVACVTAKLSANKKGEAKKITFDKALTVEQTAKLAEFLKTL